MQELIEKIIEEIGVPASLRLKKPIRGLKGYTFEDLVAALVTTDTLDLAASKLGYSNNPIKQSIRETLHPYFSNRAYAWGSNNAKHQLPWRQQLLQCINYKFCTECSTPYPIKDFWKNSGRSDGLSGVCRFCGIVSVKARKHYIVQRTPSWAELDLIEAFYRNCPEGYHVDHVIPLQGNNISGLHVLSNLQYLTVQENLSKSNKYTLI